MTRFRRFALMLGLVAGALAAQASEPTTVGWDALAPAAPPIDNPFERLTPAQMDALRLILRFELRADQAEADPAAKARIVGLRAQMAREGVDVDALFAARLEIIASREAAASAVNEDLLGQSIRMPGYVLPLEFEGRLATEFLLVPTFGACIHTPPPAPNQVVHVLYPDGIEVEGLFTPVWMTGTLTAESSMQDVTYVDGTAPVTISYRMQPVLVEKFGR